MFFADGEFWEKAWTQDRPASRYSQRRSNYDEVEWWNCQAPRFAQYSGEDEIQWRVEIEDFFYPYLELTPEIRREWSGSCCRPREAAYRPLNILPTTTSACICFAFSTACSVSLADE